MYRGKFAVILSLSDNMCCKCNMMLQVQATQTAAGADDA
jgi:hypothetical protein